MRVGSCGLGASVMMGAGDMAASRLNGTEERTKRVTLEAIPTGVRSAVAAKSKKNRNEGLAEAI